MKANLQSILLFSASVAWVPAALAKDQAINIGQCPPAVQTVIRDYSANGTFESVTLDEKKKSGGPSMYEARFSLRNGQRIELHISADGKIVGLEKKKSKN